VGFDRIAIDSETPIHAARRFAGEPPNNGDSLYFWYRRIPIPILHFVAKGPHRDIGPCLNTFMDQRARGSNGTQAFAFWGVSIQDRRFRQRVSGLAADWLPPMSEGSYWLYRGRRDLLRYEMTTGKKS
jgi:hypothetical protein